MMDGYNDGYDKGKQDAKLGDPRNPTPPLLKSIVSDRYMKDFIEGYKRGFDDQKMKNY